LAVLKDVTDLVRRHERVIWEVTLSGASGKTELFETTDDHPWWIIAADGPDHEQQGRWVTTEDLESGMTVVSRDPSGHDGSMAITSVTETDRTDSTYNLTVADFETYFVGKQRVLVHNCKHPDVPDKFADRRAPESIQDQMTLDAAKSGQGKTIIPAEKIGDPKFQGMEKASLKVESNEGKESVVNFMRDPKTSEGTDFKFKKRSDE
jgi:pretoxin HINT domain-containing protein